MLVNLSLMFQPPGDFIYHPLSFTFHHSIHFYSTDFFDVAVQGYMHSTFYTTSYSFQTQTRPVKALLIRSAGAQWKTRSSGRRSLTRAVRVHCFPHGWDSWALGDFCLGDFPDF